MSNAVGSLSNSTRALGEERRGSIVMSGTLATSLWIGLSVLNLILLAAVIVMLRRTRRSVKRRLKADRWKRHRMSAKRFNQSIWPQIESLISLYRVLDGRVDLPSMRIMAASPDFMLHVVDHIRRHAPKRIVECGAGTSTVVMAHMLKTLGHDAHIYAIENHAPTIARLTVQLRRHKLERFVTIIAVPLVERRYDGFETIFHWYDLGSGAIPSSIDLLVVDGPFSRVNAYARYPAGPELLPKLSREAHIFVDDANRREEARMVLLWQKLYPDLDIRRLRAEKGCTELFFLNRKIAPPRERDAAVVEGSLSAAATRQS